MKDTQARNPERNEQPKSSVTLALSEAAIAGLDVLAREWGVSRSELVEQIGQGQILTVPEDMAETLYLLRSPRNAERLMAALVEARTQLSEPQTVEELYQEVGLGREIA